MNLLRFHGCSGRFCLGKNSSDQSNICLIAFRIEVVRTNHNCSPLPSCSPPSSYETHPSRQIICIYVLVFAAGSSLPSASSAPSEDICHSEDCGKSSSSNADWAFQRFSNYCISGTSQLDSKRENAT